MARRLPPLNSLRAFEAAARHMSFTRAADELNVTQAAISHQVKALEDWLGFSLFRRVNRTILLTVEGQTYLPTLRDAFDQIDAATRRLSKDDGPRVLTVSTMDSFAATWLVPRMKRFRAAHPEITVRVHTADQIVDYNREGIDCGIRYGRGDWDGMHVERLMSENMSPVCSPELLASGPPLRQLDDLRHHTLLHDDMELNWSAWLRTHGITDIDTRAGPFFSHSNLTIQAAINGDGVALGRSALVAADIAAGRLVRPFPLALRSRNAHYFVCLEATAERPKIKAFRDWLFAEAAEQATAEAELAETGEEASAETG